MSDLKAQFWSFDVVFGMVIFSVGITILAAAWFGVNTQLGLSAGSGATLLQLRTDSLTQGIMSQGSPSYWYNLINTTKTSTWSSINVGIGASQSNTTLSSQKIAALASMAAFSYASSKQAVGAPYEYYITITSAAHASSSIDIKIGKDPLVHKAVSVQSESRSAVLNNIPVTVTVELWTNKSVAVS